MFVGGSIVPPSVPSAPRITPLAPTFPFAVNNSDGSIIPFPFVSTAIAPAFPDSNKSVIPSLSASRS